MKHTKESFKHIAVVPAFDPGDVVVDVVHQTVQLVDHVLLINDGSDVQNTQLLKELSENDAAVVLIEHEENQGKGFAIITGLKQALKKPCEYIVLLDSDGQHDPQEITQLLEYAHTNNSHLVLGVRSDIQKMPLKSKIGNITMALMFRLMHKQSIKDTQTGFRVLSRQFAQQVVENLEAGRYETEMKMLVMAAQNNIRIDQVPIKTTYIDGNSNSKFRPLNDSFRVLGSLLKYASVGFLSFLLDYAIYLVIAYAFSGYFLTAHLISRTLSAGFNFYANKRFVFNHEGSTIRALSKYILAVAFSLFLSTSILYFLVDYVELNKAIAKPMAEFSTFCINFFVLGHFVFRK